MEELRELLERTRKHLGHRGFSSFQSPGLLQPKFSYPFSPSAGHHVIDEIVVSNPNPQPVSKFSVIPDRSLRMYDIDKIGISKRHLSFFETLVFGYAGASEELPKEEACLKLFNLYTTFGLDPNKLVITSLNSVNAEGTQINAEEDKIFHSAWVNLLGHNQVKPTRGRRNLFYARVIGNPGGTGCELYYQVGNTYVEIGSQVNYKFKFTGGLERTRNAAILQGFGLERLLMALEEKDNVSDVSTVSPIKNLVRDYLRHYGEDETTINLYEESQVKIADSVRAILFIVHDADGNLGGLNRSQRKILNGFKNTLNSEKSELHYLGIYDSQIILDLVDLTIDIFKERYPNIPKTRGAALQYITS